MHLSCFTSKYKYVDFPKLKEHVQVVCTKSCYKTVASPTAITWRNDGPVGKEEEGCSERILLDWLMAEGNYAKFRGGPQTKGKTKRKVAAEIARIINDKGVRVPRHEEGSDLHAMIVGPVDGSLDRDGEDWTELAAIIRASPEYTPGNRGRYIVGPWITPRIR